MDGSRDPENALAAEIRRLRQRVAALQAERVRLQKERKALAWGEERSRRISEHMPRPAAIFAAGGTIETVNRAFLKRFGFATVEEAAVRCVLPREGAASDFLGLRPYFDLAREGETVLVPEFSQPSEEGSGETRDPAVFELTLFPIADPGGPIGRVAVVWWEITERIKTEALLRAQHEFDQRLAGSSDLQETLRIFLETALRVSGTDLGAVFGLDEVTGVWTMAASAGLPAPFLERIMKLREARPNIQLPNADKPIYIRIQDIPDPDIRGMLAREGIRSIAILPIKSKGQFTVSLNIGSLSQDSIPRPARLALETISGQMGNVLARLRMETALLDSEHRFRVVTDNLRVAVYRNDPAEAGRFIDFNQALVDMLGFLDPAELRRTPVRDIYQNAEERTAFVGDLAAMGKVRNRILHLRRRDGSPFTASCSAVAIRDEAGAFRYIDGIIEDVTERKTAEKALETSERTYRALFEQSQDGVILFDLAGMPLAVNPRILRMMNTTRAELLNLNYLDMAAESEKEDDLKKFRALLEGVTLLSYDRTLRRRDGSTFEAEITPSLVRDPEGRALFIQSIIRDITEQKRAEAEIQAALREKEVLLREIHHRVKNNMQVIISLLRLQARSVRDPGSLEIFRSTQNRIRSMSLVHDKLYRSPDLSAVDFKDYIESLVPSLISSAGFENVRVALRMELEPALININKVISCGLILNELVSNCMRHAFPDGRKGTIRIRLSVPEPDRLVLTVSDDGVGLPEDIDTRQPQTLGLQIVRDLARQIDGRLEIGPPPGTTVSLFL